MLPSKEELKRLAKNIDYIDACKLDCKKCDWLDEKLSCVTLARIELKKMKVLEGE
jgi:hypothetical protein